MKKTRIFLYRMQVYVMSKFRCCMFLNLIFISKVSHISSSHVATFFLVSVLTCCRWFLLSLISMLQEFIIKSYHDAKFPLLLIPMLQGTGTKLLITLLLRYKVATFKLATLQTCYGSNLLRVKLATGSNLLRVKLATYKFATLLNRYKLATVKLATEEKRYKVATAKLATEGAALQSCYGSKLLPREKRYYVATLRNSMK
jgi:hypothetical protein